MAALQFERMCIGQAPVALQYVSLAGNQHEFKGPAEYGFLQTFATKYGVHYSRPGNGICHYLHVERCA